MVAHPTVDLIPGTTLRCSGIDVARGLTAGRNGLAHLREGARAVRLLASMTRARRRGIGSVRTPFSYRDALLKPRRCISRSDVSRDCNFAIRVDIAIFRPCCNERNARYNNERIDELTY